MLLHMSRAHNENSIKYTPAPAKPNKQSFECEVCDYKGRNKLNLVRHMSMIHSSVVKGNVTWTDKKRKLPDKKEKCDICGRMLLNLKGLDLHKRRMHMVKENNSSKKIVRTDSVRSSISVKSATSQPPKKHEKDSTNGENPKKREKQMTEEIPLQNENAMDTEEKLNPDKCREVKEDLRLAKLEIVILKRENNQLRNINKTQIESKSNTIKYIESEHLRAIKIFEDENNKAVQEIARLKKENQLSTAREKVILATMDSDTNQKDECIMNIKCKGDCTHVKEINPVCPFCNINHTNLHVLRRHIDEHHPDTALHTSQADTALAGPSTRQDTPAEEEVSNPIPQDTTEGGEAEGHLQEEEEGDESQQEKQGETGDWHRVGRQGGRFQCQVCGYTRNTRQQLEKHMQERHDDNEDDTMKSNRNPQIYCDICDKQFMTQREVSHHMNSDHKSYKPCTYLKEGKCEVDGECRYNHEILLPGQEICYKCGKKFKAKKDLLKHIEEKHGHETCHRFLQNKCTIRRCLFSHVIPSASNVERTTQAPLNIQQDFPQSSPIPLHSPHIKVSNMSTKIQSQLQLQSPQVKGPYQVDVMNMIPQIVAQVVAALTMQLK